MARGASPFLKGHVISGLTIKSILTGVGLFAYTSGASIENLGLVNVSIRGTANVGGLAGSSGGGAITACYTTGSVTATSNRAGGLVGILQSGLVANAYSQAAVNAVS